MRYNIIEITVCDPCMQLMCNGEINDGENTARNCKRGQRETWGDDRRYLTPGNTAHGYSTTTCEGCGNADHGERYSASVMIPLTKIRTGKDGRMYVSSKDGSYTEVYHDTKLVSTIQRDWRDKLRKYAASVA